jgi:hypothetical protein
VELHAALEKIKEDSGRWNKRLAKLRTKQEAACATAAPPKLPQARQRPAGSDPARTARRSKDRVRPNPDIQDADRDASKQSFNVIDNESRCRSPRKMACAW